MRKLIIRAARKSAHISTSVLNKVLHVTTKVEDKATKLLNGSDFSHRIHATVPLEKVYYGAIPHITPLNPALPAVGSRASVTLLIPSLDNSSFFGGTRTAFIIAAKIAYKQKRPLHIVQTLKPGSSDRLQEWFERDKLDLNPDDVTVSDVSSRRYNLYGYLPMHADDTLIASAWWDAKLIQDLPRRKRFIYIIQDFEPIFYENSDRYILAEATYKQDNFIPLCNTELMYEFMKERGYPAMPRGTFFEPAVSLGDGRTLPARRQGTKRRLFFYGRTNVARNLFHTGLASIDLCFNKDMLNPNEWELFMAGQDNVPDIKLSSGVIIQNLGKMSMEDYTDFSRTIDVAVSLMMAPHPNYPTLEFASLGAAVVTTKYANKKDLSHYSKNIIAADTNEESIAGAINSAAKMSKAERESNLRASRIASDWNKALDAPIADILKS